MNIVADKVAELGLVTKKKLVGTVSCKMRDAEGNVVFEDTVHNNILLNIRKTIVELLAGSTYTTTNQFPFIKSLVLGTSSDKTPDSLSLNALISPIAGSESEVRMATIAGTDDDSKSPSVTFAFLYSASYPAIEADDTVIREMGLLDNKGRLVARTTVGGWQKRQGIYFEIYWTVGYAE